MDHQPNVLRNRFLYFARPVDIFLKAAGVYLFLPDTAEGLQISSIAWKEKFPFLWSGFWLVLNTQSSFYIFLRRGYGHVYKILFNSKLLIGGKLTDELTGALMRLSVFVFETSIHYMLVLSIQRIFKRFFSILEPVYHYLGHPELSQIRCYSKACLTFTIWTVRKQQ